jgi:hypothetical protein
LAAGSFDFYFLHRLSYKAIILVRKCVRDRDSDRDSEF